MRACAITTTPSPPSEWNVADVQNFLLRIPDDEVAAAVIQRAVDSVKFHGIDGSLLQEIESIHDVRYAFDIARVGDCLKVRSYIRRLLAM